MEVDKVAQRRWTVADGRDGGHRRWWSWRVRWRPSAGVPGGGGGGDRRRREGGWRVLPTAEEETV
jgi:hypothetical protein